MHLTLTISKEIYLPNLNAGLTYDIDTYAISQNQGTYLGTFYTTAAGQTGMACAPGVATGGTNNILGLWNAYNRITVSASCIEQTSSWTYSTPTNTFRPANNSTSNRISWVDGLAQSAITATYNGLASNSGNNQQSTGVGINNTSTAIYQTITQGTAVTPFACNVTNYPLLGFNFAEALESVSGGTATFYGFPNEVLRLTLDM